MRHMAVLNSRNVCLTCKRVLTSLPVHAEDSAAAEQSSGTCLAACMCFALKIVIPRHHTEHDRRRHTGTERHRLSLAPGSAAHRPSTLVPRHTTSLPAVRDDVACYQQVWGLLSRASTGSIARKSSMRASGDAVLPNAEQEEEADVEAEPQIAAGPDANPDVLLDGFKPPEVRGPCPLCSFAH